MAQALKGQWIRASDGQPAFQTPDGKLYRKNPSGKTVLVPNLKAVSLLSATPAPAVPQEPLSGWFRRVAGTIIDSAILTVPVGVLYVAIFRGIVSPLLLNESISTSATYSTSMYKSFTAVTAGAYLSQYVAAVVAFVVYCGIMNGTERGQSVGQMAVGIAVRDKKTRQPIGYARAFKRMLEFQFYAILTIAVLGLGLYFNAQLNVLVIAQIVLGFIALINVLWPLWSKYNQTWHDELAKAVVVKVR